MKKAKDVGGIHGVRIPLRFCPFCGERLFKENKKEAAPFTPDRFGDSTVILEEETDKELDRGRDYDLGGLIANHPDKPCRMMREQLHLKNNLCGDLPAFAPEGKCYIDYQKNCNAWCSFWEGNEDDEKVKNIREIQKNIANCSLPRYKIVENKK